MTRFLWRALAAVSLAACAEGPNATVMPPEAPALSKTGGTTSASYAMSGDLGPLLTPTGGVVTGPLATRPFGNLTLKNVKLTIGASSQLSGNGARCRTLYPNRTVVPNADGTIDTWDGAVRGDWVGELVIWQGKGGTAQSNMRFAGQRPGDATKQVQFTSNSTNAVQTQSAGTTTLQFIDAPLGFGAGTGRYVPVDAAGLPIIYCVNVTVTAAASQ